MPGTQRPVNGTSSMTQGAWDKIKEKFMPAIQEFKFFMIKDMAKSLYSKMINPKKSLYLLYKL